jgi:hypothetical protein
VAVAEMGKQPPGRSDKATGLAASPGAGPARGTSGLKQAGPKGSQAEEVTGNEN